MNATPYRFTRFLPHFIVLTVLSLFLVLGLAGIIPSMAELSFLLSHIIEEGGLGLVIGASFLENLPAVNAYFPGSVVLLVRMSSTAGKLDQAIIIYLAIVTPAILANLLTFGAGRLLRQRKNLATSSGIPNATRYRSLWIWYALTYWHPHLASMTALASGSEGVSPPAYLRTFLPISLAWSVLWATLLYNVGVLFDPRSQLVWLSWVYLVAWFLWDLRKLRREQRVNHEKELG